MSSLWLDKFVYYNSSLNNLVMTIVHDLHTWWVDLSLSWSGPLRWIY